MLTTKSLYRGLLVVAIAITFGSFNNPQAARAGTYRYDFANSESGGDSNCRNQVDPINTLFEGDFATADKLEPLIDKHVGWGHNTTEESDGMLKHDGGCYFQDDFAKLGNVEGHHTRLWTSGESDRFGRYFTTGDAHREHAGDSTQCPGDSVYYRFAGHSGYDEGAYEIYHGTRGHADKHGLGPDGYYQRTIHRPHRHTYHQCNDNPRQTMVGWNGQEIEYHYTSKDPG